MARYLRTMVAALAATTITGADANAAWTATFPVSAPAGIAELPQVRSLRRVSPPWCGPGTRARRSPSTRAAWTPAAGALGDVLTLSAPGEIGFSPVVGVDGDGDAVVVWTRYANPDFRVQTRRIDAGGALGPIDDVTPDSRSNFDYDLAVDPAGDSVVVWPWRAGADTVIQWRRLGGPIEDLTAAGSSAFDPQVAIDHAGVSTAVWYRDDGTVQARRSAAGGGLLPIVDLSTTESVDPSVAVDPSGDATGVWQRWDGVTDRIELRRYLADGTLEPVRDLWTGGDDVRPRVAVDGLGHATTLWLHPGLRTRTAVPDGSLGPSLDLTDEEVQSPELATDAAGRTIAVWVRDDLIEGARILPPPSPPAPQGRRRPLRPSSRPARP